MRRMAGKTQSIFYGAAFGKRKLARLAEYLYKKIGMPLPAAIPPVFIKELPQGF